MKRMVVDPALRAVNDARAAVGREPLLGGGLRFRPPYIEAEHPRDPGGEDGGQWIKKPKFIADLDNPAGPSEEDRLNIEATVVRDRATVAAQRLALKAKAAEPTITALLTAASESVGARLSGLAHRFKEDDGIVRKLTDWYYDYGTDPAEGGDDYVDSLRYTMVANEGNYTAMVRRTLEALEAAGNTVRKVSNYWTDDGGYSGINAEIVNPDGLIWEMQFHTEESLKRKRLSHEFYKKIRDPSLPEEERVRLEREAAGIWRDLAQPPGWQSVGRLKSIAERNRRLKKGRPKRKRGTPYPFGFLSPKDAEGLLDRFPVKPPAEVPTPPAGAPAVAGPAV